MVITALTHFTLWARWSGRNSLYPLYTLAVSDGYNIINALYTLGAMVITAKYALYTLGAMVIIAFTHCTLWVRWS